MNLLDIHNQEKPLQIQKIFGSSEGSVISIQLLENAELKEHITKTPALLLGINGETVYEDEKGHKVNISNGDFYQIEPNVKHWLISKTKSNLILIKL